MRRTSDDLDDLARFEAARADLHALDLALDPGTHRHEVDVPAPLGHVVGVTDAVADGRTLPADIATLSHADPLLSVCGLPDGAFFYSMASGMRQTVAPEYDAGRRGPPRGPGGAPPARDGAPVRQGDRAAAGQAPRQP